ncbi:hypothetical protein LINPERHAP1_LOCUS13008, partial [Linum perenne]
IGCAISLSLSFFSRHSSQTSAYLHRSSKSAGDYLEPNRPATIWNQIGRRLLLLVRTCPSVLFFMDTSTGGDGSSNKNSSSTASTKGVGVKQKTDIAWNYFEDLIDENGNKNDAPVNTMNELTRSGSSGPVRVSTVDDYFAPRTVAGDQPGIKAALAGYRETWAKHGCTLMSDGWTDKRGRT